VRIEGAQHEFTTIPGVREDVTDMILNLKGLVLRMEDDSPEVEADIVKSGEAEAEAIKNRAIAEINRAKDQALDELFSTLARQVSQATEQVVGRALTGSDQERLIQDAVQQFARQKA